MATKQPTTPITERTHKLACRIYSQVRKKTGNVSLSRAQMKTLYGTMVLSETLLSKIYTGEAKQLERVKQVRGILESKKAMFTQWQYDQMTALLSQIEPTISGSVKIEELCALTASREIVENEYKEQIGKAIK